jgi:hypothetical protein
MSLRTATPRRRAVGSEPDQGEPDPDEKAAGGLRGGLARPLCAGELVQGN